MASAYERLKVICDVDRGINGLSGARAGCRRLGLRTDERKRRDEQWKEAWAGGAMASLVNGLIAALEAISRRYRGIGEACTASDNVLIKHQNLSDIGGFSLA